MERFGVVRMLRCPELTAGIFRKKRFLPGVILILLQVPANNNNSTATTPNNNTAGVVGAGDNLIDLENTDTVDPASVQPIHGKHDGAAYQPTASFRFVVVDVGG